MFDYVPGVKSCHNDPASKRKATIERIRNLAGDYNIYTDGSTSGGCLEGGAAAVITIGYTENPITVDRIMQRGRRLTYSYKEETWCNGVGH